MNTLVSFLYNHMIYLNINISSNLDLERVFRLELSFPYVKV